MFAHRWLPTRDPIIGPIAASTIKALIIANTGLISPKISHTKFKNKQERAAHNPNRESNIELNTTKKMNISCFMNYTKLNKILSEQKHNWGEQGVKAERREQKHKPEHIFNLHDQCINQNRPHTPT